MLYDSVTLLYEQLPLETLLWCCVRPLSIMQGRGDVFSQSRRLLCKLYRACYRLTIWHQTFAGIKISVEAENCSVRKQYSDSAVRIGSVSSTRIFTIINKSMLQGQDAISSMAGAQEETYLCTCRFSHCFIQPPVSASDVQKYLCVSANRRQTNALFYLGFVNAAHVQWDRGSRKLLE